MTTLVRVLSGLAVVVGGWAWSAGSPILGVGVMIVGIICFMLTM